MATTNPPVIQPASTSFRPASRLSRFGRSILPYLYLVPAFVVMGIVVSIYQVIISFATSKPDLLLGMNSPSLNESDFRTTKRFDRRLMVRTHFTGSCLQLWWAITNVLVHVPRAVVSLLNVRQYSNASIAPSSPFVILPGHRHLAQYLRRAVWGDEPAPDAIFADILGGTEGCRGVHPTIPWRSPRCR
jgi:hypothetical protein